ncbi:MAG: hypothetical protein IH593_10850 [Bacteroidales bacterium]|nr:hypothetical protein [Bacteroidales bacterium]
MELLKNLRLKAGRYMLHRQLSSVRRMHQDFNREKVRKIGILWDATYENDFQHLAALNRRLSDMGKSVEVMAWIPGRIVPDRLTGLTYMKFLRKTDLNWAFIPVSEDAKKFIANSFDLIIDINPSSVFHLSCLVALSAAPMKVGPDVTEEPEKTPYDMMIRTPKPFSIAAFIEQAMIYLSMISSPETRA